MLLTRLTRLLSLLTLMRRAACHALLGARICFATGQRARGLRDLRSYRRLRADIDARELDAVKRITALIKQPASSF